MPNKSKITGSQFKILVIGFIIGSSVLLAPSLLAIEVEQDAWVSALIGLAGGMLLILLYNALGKRFPQQTLVEYSELVLGKWLGIAVSVMFVSFAFILSTVMVKYMADFITSQIMPETPVVVISFIIMSLVAMGAFLGLNSIGRTAQAFFPFTILMFIFMVFLISPRIDIRNITPMFQSGMVPIFRSSIRFTSIPYLELALFLMLYPFVKVDPGQRNRAFIFSGWFGGVVLVIVTGITLLVLGADLTKNTIYPSFSLAKKISIGHVIERVEAILGIVWFFTLFIKLIICYYATTLGCAQIFRLKDYRTLLLPLAVIILALSNVVYPNTVYAMNFILKTWPPYTITIGLFIPLLLLVVALIRKLRRG